MEHHLRICEQDHDGTSQINDEQNCGAPGILSRYFELAQLTGE